MVLLREGYYFFLRGARRHTTHTHNTAITCRIKKLQIEEGKKYNIQNVSIENLVPGVDTKDVLEQLPLKNGMTYSVNKVEEAIDKLTDIILLQGYPFIVVVPEVQRVENKSLINVNLRVNEAEKIYHDFNALVPCPRISTTCNTFKYVVLTI